VRKKTGKNIPAKGGRKVDEKTIRTTTAEKTYGRGPSLHGKKGRSGERMPKLSFAPKEKYEGYRICTRG